MCGLSEDLAHSLVVTVMCALVPVDLMPSVLNSIVYTWGTGVHTGKSLVHIK